MNSGPGRAPEQDGGPDVELRLRAALADRARHAVVSADAAERIRRRVGARRAQVPIPTLASAVAATALVTVTMLVAGTGVVAPFTPDGAGLASSSSPIWPAASGPELEEMQSKVDEGHLAWLRDAELVARRYLEGHAMQPHRVDYRHASLAARQRAAVEAAGVVRFEEGSVHVARSGGPGSIWYVVGAVDSDLSVVSATVRGTEVVVEYRGGPADAVVVARAGDLERRWASVRVAAVEAGRTARMELDTVPAEGAYGPALPVLVQLVRSSGGARGLTELRLGG